MRLELRFLLKYPSLPVDNKRIWISFLKNCLSKSGDGKFYKNLFYRNIKNMVLEVNFSIWQKKFLQPCCILVHSLELKHFMRKMSVKRVYSRI